MTSKLIIDIRAKEELGFWYQKLRGYYSRDDRYYYPKAGTTVRPHIELGILYFMGSGGNFNYEAAINHIKTALIAECRPHCLYSMSMAITFDPLSVINFDPLKINFFAH